MGLPEQLQKQIDDTEAFYKKPEDEVEDTTQVEDGPTDQAEDSTVSDTAPIQAVEDTPTDDSTPATDDVSTDTPSSTSTEQQPSTISAEEFNALQRRHSSLQGMYNSTDARLRQANEQIEQLRTAISTLQPKATETPTPQSAEPAGVTKEEIKEYTPEFFDMMKRYTAEQLGPIRNQLDSMQEIPQAVNQINDRLQNVSSAQTQTAEQVFFNDLAASHPDWEQVNTSQEFADWLQVADPYTGITRQVYLDEARKRLDFEHVSNIFGGFKSTRTNTGTSVPNKSQKKEELQQQAVVTPTKNQHKTPTANEPKTFTKADLDKLYVDERMGKYKGPEKQAEFRALEVELLKAITEERYTG